MQCSFPSIGDFATIISFSIYSLGMIALLEFGYLNDLNLEACFFTLHSMLGKQIVLSPPSEPMAINRKLNEPNLNMLFERMFLYF
jgi:hypothetical protein